VINDILISLLSRTITDMNPSKTTRSFDCDSNLPPGFSLQEASDGSKFAVPRFLLPAAQSAFDAHNMKNSLNIDDIKSKVVLFCFNVISSLTMPLNLSLPHSLAVAALFAVPLPFSRSPLPLWSPCRFLSLARRGCFGRRAAISLKQ
jgi:hypothetical protein